MCKRMGTDTFNVRSGSSNSPRCCGVVSGVCENALGPARLVVKGHRREITKNEKATLRIDMPAIGGMCK